jgi:hypothetical protein
VTRRTLFFEWGYDGDFAEFSEIVVENVDPSSMHTIIVTE